MAPVHEFTSNISGCMWPMTGLAPASRIRGGTLDGPGPNMCRCGTVSGRSSRCGGGTARDDMFPAARAAEKWSLRRQNRACGGRRTTLRPPTSQLGSSDGVTTLSANTGLPLNTVGSQASVQVGVNHWAESLRSIRSTVHLTDLTCCSWLGANDFSGFWCKVSLKIDDLLQWPHDAILRKLTLNSGQIFLFNWTRYFVCCKYTHLFNTVKIIDKLIRKNATWMPLSKSRKMSIFLYVYIYFLFHFSWTKSLSFYSLFFF